MITTTESMLHFAFGMPGGPEMIVLLVLGLLIFGRRLPEVGRNLGKSIVEFKRGVKNITDDIDSESEQPARTDRLESQPASTSFAGGAGEAANAESVAEKPQTNG